MKNLLKQLKKGSREVRLTADEKSVMRQSLAQFARKNPIMHTSRANSSRVVVSPYSFMRKARGWRMVSATVIGGILIGGTVSFAAEGALPGNVLYPVKTELNERVRSVAAVTPQAKAEWDVKLVERRLTEMKEVGLLETVPPETKEVARENVKKYTERAQKRIVELDDNDDEEGALEVAENLAQVLRTHETILLEDLDENEDEGGLDDSEDNKDEKNKVEGKEVSKSQKETKQVRTVVATSTRATNIRATSTPLVNAKGASNSRENEQSDNVRTKTSDTTSLEKTVKDIREVRENLEKRNKEKKVEYEKRKESQKEDEEREEREERKTFISTPSSESER